MRERLLIIAQRVPHFDENSGDLRFFSIIELLSESYDISYFTQADIGEELSDNRYVESLKRLGVDVLSSGEHSIRDILHEHRIKAAIFEFYFMAEYYLPRVRMLQPGCRCIIDTVDIHYVRETMKSQITGSETDWIKAQNTKARELAVYKKADVVITVTGEDADALRKDLPGLKVLVIPNIHNIVVSRQLPQKNRLIFVGGFSHDPNVDAVLYFCKDVFPMIKRDIPRIHFTIVGSNPPRQIRELNDDWIEVTGYVPSTTPYLHSSYISVAPLRYGAGMKGKIGEAMAHGIPVVTTAVGVQGMGLVNGKNILIGDSKEEITRCIVRLIQDERLYTEIRDNGIQYISDNYTPMRVAGKIEAVMDSLDNLPLRRVGLAEGTKFLSNYMRDFSKNKVASFFYRRKG